MIKEEELKVGNYFMNADFETYRVSDIHNGYVSQIRDYGTGTFWIGVIEPIPLTLEILEQCGFESYDRDRLCIVIEDFQFNLYREQLTVENISEKNEVHNEVNALHKLQNIIEEKIKKEWKIRRPIIKKQLR